LLIAAACIVTANASVRTTYGALMGEVVRVVENPFDPVKRIGFGLADDGTYLYATAVDDGIIRVIDRQSLEVLREIPTPATKLFALEVRDGLVYAGDPNPHNASPDTPNVFVVNALSGAGELQFTMPFGTRTGSFSFGPDGFLYVLSGFDSRRESGAPEVFAVNPATGAIEREYHGYEYYDEYLERYVSDLYGLSLYTWLPGGDILLDLVGPNNLAFASVEGNVFNAGAEFIVEGIAPWAWRGSAVHGRTLWLWGQRPGERALFEITLVPEPSSVFSALLLLIICLILRGVSAVRVAPPGGG
jgi:DNA-binding beta-propeller fold protein YncE